MSLTAKQERFCHEIVKGQSQADAYRAAYKPKRMSKKTTIETASRLAKKRNVVARVAELMAPLVANVQLTREQWIEDGIRLYNGDVRKLFDTHGNAIDIPHLSDSEADCIEGFEVVEDFTKVKQNDGTTDAVPTGYTKKIKFTGRKQRHEYVGKALGYYTERHEIKAQVTVEFLVGLLTNKDPKVING